MEVKTIGKGDGRAQHDLAPPPCRQDPMKRVSKAHSVWMIIPSFYPAIGGAENQVRLLSKRLLAHGRPVRVLTRQHGNALPNGLAASDVVGGVPVRRLYSRGWGKVGSLLYLLGGWWYLLRHGRRAIYHANAVGTAGWLAVTARYLLGGRCLIKMRTGYQGYEKHYGSGIARWQFVTLLRLADRVQVVNTEVERMVRNLGVPRDRVVRLSNAVDTKVFRPASIEEKSAARKRVGIPAEKTIVLWVGRMAPVKGLDLLLRAWALLPEPERADVLLVMVGEGPERDKLLEMMTQLGLGDSVCLAGAHKTVRDYYWAADLFVLPSRTEGLSGALIEAMASGLPVIASNVGGAIDLVIEDENGSLFIAEDRHQLAQKLAAMIGTSDRWAEMGRRARQTVTASAEMDVIATQLDDLYQELI